MRQLALVIAIGLLTGCVSQQFDLGPEVSPPPGCIEARTRGHDC